MKKILITGGAGFIGFNIANILSKNKNNDIILVDNFSRGRNDDDFKRLLKKRNITFLQADLADPKSYSRFSEDFHHIYHLAAVVGVKNVTENPTETIRDNTLSTVYLLDYLKDCTNKPKLLFTSSCEVYAGTINCFKTAIPTPENIPLCIEDVYNPRWTYAASKLLGEMMCLQYSKKFQFKTTIVRYHNIYGPRMGIEHVIPEFIIRLKRDPSHLEMFGGDQYRTFCYVSDAAKMTINLMNNEKSNFKIINIGNDMENIKISSIGEKLSEIMNITPEFIEKGAPLGSPHQRIPDLTLIKNLGNFVYEVPFTDGIKRSYRWYAKNWKTLGY
jgi:UDP-glucose 4-epimerase